MFYQNALVAIALLTATALPGAGVRAQDAARYPDWRGQWERFVVPGVPGTAHDQTKPQGYGQEAPLTPEYQKIFEASLADQRKAGLCNFPTAWCLGCGMHLMDIAFCSL